MIPNGTWQNVSARVDAGKVRANIDKKVFAKNKQNFFRECEKSDPKICLRVGESLIKIISTVSCAAPFPNLCQETFQITTAWRLLFNGQSCGSKNSFDKRRKAVLIGMSF